MTERSNILLAGIPRSSRIVEIGPSFAPLAPKSDGWNSAAIDHLSRAGLAAKYRDHPGVDTSRIEEVDFVWSGGTLSDAVPIAQHGSFDVFLASHVIEHTPDLVGFLDAAASLLTADGLVVLAVPDKRYCFDYFQALTTTGQLLDAHANRRAVHAGAHVFDHFAYAATDGGAEAWAQRPSQGLGLLHRLETARAHYDAFGRNADYADLHAWCFVPPSFELLLLELARLGETDWQVAEMTRTTDWEFFVRLRRGGMEAARALSDETFRDRRIALLKTVMLEGQEQIDWLLATEPGLTPISLAPSAAVVRAEDEAARLRRALAATEHRLDAAERRIAGIEASTSWKATAPLRSIAASLRPRRERRRAF